MWPNPRETADLVTFTGEILNGKLHFLCSVNWARRQVKKKQPSHWRCYSIVETNNDSWENCEDQFQKIIKGKLEIEKNNEIDGCHRETIDFKKFK